jgi:hypothetical protein
MTTMSPTTTRTTAQPHHSGRALSRSLDTSAVVSEARRRVTPYQKAATPPATNAPPMRTRPETPGMSSAPVDLTAVLWVPTLTTAGLASRPPSPRWPSSRAPRGSSQGCEEWPSSGSAILSRRSRLRCRCTGRQSMWPPLAAPVIEFDARRAYADDGRDGTGVVVGGRAASAAEEDVGDSLLLGWGRQMVDEQGGRPR